MNILKKFLDINEEPLFVQNLGIISSKHSDFHVLRCNIIDKLETGKSSKERDVPQLGIEEVPLTEKKTLSCITLFVAGDSNPHCTGRISSNHYLVSC